jgi:hypothetical protein
MTWRVFLAAVLTALLSFAALEAPRAQFNGCAAGFCSPVSSAPYVGPGDITSGAIAFYSAGRAYNAAYAASNGNLADLVATGNGAVVCTLKALSTGYVNLTSSACSGSTPAAACAAANGGSCKVTKLYDQTGTGNHVVQATLANMPALTFGAQNGLPCPAGTGSTSMILSTAGTLSQALPFTLTSVAERAGSFTTRQDIFDNNTGTNNIRFANIANSIFLQQGAVNSLTAADSAFHAILGVVSATAPLFAIDSSANTNTSTNGTTAWAAAATLMGRGGSTTPILSGFVCEAGLWPADLNSSYQAMLANMRSAIWGWNF